MIVVFITGSYPPDICGVGDYTYKLASTLKSYGISVKIITHKNWRILNVCSIIKHLNNIKSDIIHIQYPTVGFGSKLGPQMISILKPCIITLHEVSQTHILRRLSLYPFTIRSRHIIFTNSFERDYSVKYAPWISSRSSIIPIGSNIPSGKYETEIINDDKINEITYFGLIRPQKGLEDVLTLAKLIKEKYLPLCIRIIGMPDPRQINYYNELRVIAKDYPVIWDIGLSEKEVAKLLARSKIAYVPFPDGASERRGSLLALLSNAVATVTTRGLHTPSDLDGVVEFASNPEQALKVINKIIYDKEWQMRLIKNGLAYANRFTWENIAAKHIELYEKILLVKQNYKS